MAQLQGKVAVIIGGGSGIGKGIARAFAQEGCCLVLAGRSAERLRQAAEEFAPLGAQILTAPVDCTDEAQVKQLFQDALARFGRVDILVNSAGAFDGGPIDEISLQAWQRVMDTNVTAAFLCTREVFPIMKANGGGRILNIGSISAQHSRENMAPYTTSKFAIWGLTQASALDGRDYGIAVSCLHPGNTLVERRAGETEPMMSTEDIARVALLMATLPPEVNMLESIVLPVTQKYLGRG
ncbi:MAG: SDR family oxidoreductase [Chloroflexi bacterium]|nr:SDR family oxidoreductase [Chloroflexota bacterium]